MTDYNIGPCDCCGTGTGTGTSTATGSDACPCGEQGCSFTWNGSTWDANAGNTTCTLLCSPPFPEKCYCSDPVGSGTLIGETQSTDCNNVAAAMAPLSGPPSFPGAFDGAIVHIGQDTYMWSEENEDWFRVME